MNETMSSVKTRPALTLGHMSERDFNKFSQFIHERVGIKLPPSKKNLVETRLQKRMRALGLPSHREYMHYAFSTEGMEKELSNLIDAITTNTTHFFRENQHFVYLAKTLLPRWLEKNGRYRKMRIWSAGCSIGMEPYTLAMVLSEFKEAVNGFEFEILATDISTQALREASQAIYFAERVEPVPEHMKRKYLLRSRDRSKGLVRVVPELRKAVKFMQLNFMEEFSFDQPFDVIFCRNVVIYFDRETQAKLFTKFCRNLKQGGNLFIGHSESLTGMALPLRQEVPTVYCKI